MENRIVGQYRIRGSPSVDVNGQGPQHDSASDIEDGTSDATAHEPIPARRPSVAVSRANTPYRIIHRVKCRKVVVTGEDHSTHLRTADFLDTPRLWAKDSRASALRGSTSIDAESDLWHESRVKIVREYDCMSYHRKFTKRFKPLITSLDRQVYARIQPWIDALTETAPEAESVSCRLLLNVTRSGRAPNLTFAAPAVAD